MSETGRRVLGLAMSHDNMIGRRGTHSLTISIIRAIRALVRHVGPRARERENAIVRLLIIERFALIRSGLRGLLAELDRDIEFIELSSIDEALSKEPASFDADLAVISYDVPQEGMFAQISGLHQHLPQIRIVLLTEHIDSATARRAIAAGAAGFIPKSANTQVMISALKLVLSGEVFIPSSIFDSTQHADHGIAGLRVPKKPPGRLGDLSQRQMEVLRLLAAGKSNSTIAHELRIEPGTVKNHVQAILRTLKVHNRTQAVRIAVDAGLTPLAPIERGAV